jgi:hypothetical protein
MAWRSLGGVWLAFTLLIGAAQAAPSDDDSRRIADAKFMQVVKVIGSKATAAPEPEIEKRADETVYVYVEPTYAKRVTVTVSAQGESMVKVQGP